MLRKDYDPQSPWGRLVLETLRKHGKWTRDQYPLTGIRHSTVNGWLADTPPQADGVIKFAKGFGLDLAEALRTAGHDPAQYLAGLDYDPRAEAIREEAEAVGPTTESCVYLLIEETNRDPDQAKPWAERIVKEARPWAEQIVAEYRATYEVKEEPALTPPTDPLRDPSPAWLHTIPETLPTSEESPFLLHFWERVKDAFTILFPRNYRLPDPFSISQRVGWLFPTEEAANRQFERWVERIRRANDRLTSPEELLGIPRKEE